jgi:hypothetical protein
VIFREGLDVAAPECGDVIGVPIAFWARFFPQALSESRREFDVTFSSFSAARALVGVVGTIMGLENQQSSSMAEATTCSADAAGAAALVGFEASMGDALNEGKGEGDDYYFYAAFFSREGDAKMQSLLFFTQMTTAPAGRTFLKKQQIPARGVWGEDPRVSFPPFGKGLGVTRSRNVSINLN